MRVDAGLMVVWLHGGLLVLGASLFLFGLEFVPRNYGIDNCHIPVMGLYHTRIPTLKKVVFGDRRKITWHENTSMIMGFSAVCSDRHSRSCMPGQSGRLFLLPVLSERLAERLTSGLVKGRTC